MDQMHEMDEALAKKRKGLNISLMVDGKEVAVVQDGKAVMGDSGSVDDEEPSPEKDLRNNPDQAPGVYDKDEEEIEDGEALEDGEEPDMASKIFDEPETMRMKAQGQKPRGLTERAAFAAFKGRKS